MTVDRYTNKDALGAVRELVAQMRHELAADKGWDYTEYEKGRIAEKQRCLSLLESALAQAPAVWVAGEMANLRSAIMRLDGQSRRDTLVAYRKLEAALGQGKANG